MSWETEIEEHDHACSGLAFSQTRVAGVGLQAKCLVCGRVFNSRDNLWDHLRLSLATRKRMLALLSSRELGTMQ